MFMTEITCSENKVHLAGKGAQPAPRRARIGCPQTLRGWRFSRHAQSAVDARRFTPHEVIEACERPEVAMSANDYGSGRMRFVRGRVVVIAVPARSEIITVLLRTYDTWDNADARQVTGR